MTKKLKMSTSMKKRGLFKKKYKIKSTNIKKSRLKIISRFAFR